MKGRFSSVGNYVEIILKRNAPSFQNFQMKGHSLGGR